MSASEVSVRGGRPQLPDDIRRDHRIVTMVTLAEFRALKTLAEHQNTSLSALCHNLLVNSLAGHVPVAPPDTKTPK